MQSLYKIIPQSEFERIAQSSSDKISILQAIADMCRLNALTAVKIAGSGHLGSSLSSMEIFTYLYHAILHPTPERLTDPDRHIFFSSKGHDVPGQYSVLYSLGIINQEQLLKLRRLGGLDGHPDIHVPGIEANSGSLGMGISKAKGMAWAKKASGRKGHVFVLTGDGEFQEGQNFEALQSAIPQGISHLTVIMDHNKVQSDKKVDEIVSLGNFREKVKQFGWKVLEIDGNNLHEIESAIAISMNITDRPVFIIAHTVKGKGVCFMEHPTAMQQSGGLYPFHAGAPDDEKFERAVKELSQKINRHFERMRMGGVQFMQADTSSVSHAHLNELGEPISQAAPRHASLKASAEYVVEGYGQALAELGAEIPELLVLDADLSADCRLRYFEKQFPDRFIECGIAEQDMVSMAGGLARHGWLPVVNSFASFLASRANEQIYNNATERSHIIYAFHYAGLIPAGPGKSHQSLRDISLVTALPDITILQPSNPAEARMALEYCIHKANGPCVLRMNISPSPRPVVLPENYHLEFGKGAILKSGSSACLLTYGPVMLNEALLAAETLETEGLSVSIVNMPWINHPDTDWVLSVPGADKLIITVDDHAVTGGMGDLFLAALNAAGQLKGRKVHRMGVEGHPACGTPAEALQFHRLDAASLEIRIKKLLKK